MVQNMLGKGETMKHYVLGLIFNKTKQAVLLVEKKKPKWQAGRWNGIGGEIEVFDVEPFMAMERESREETGHYDFDFEHAITFVCPGGTIYVYKSNSEVDEIPFKQTENEQLLVFPLRNLPSNMMTDLKWIIPVCLSNLQFPIVVQQNSLGNA